MSIERTFLNCPEQFQDLLTRKNLAYSEVHLQILACRILIRASSFSTKTPEEIGRAARAVFIASRDIFSTFGSTFNPDEQRDLLEFAIYMVTSLHGLPAGAVLDLEQSVVDISSVAIKLFENPQAGQGQTNPFLTLRYISKGLAAINPRAASVRDEMNLLNRCISLIVRDIEKWEEKSFRTLAAVLCNAITNLSQFGGISTHILDHWRTLLTSFQNEKRAVVAIRLFEITNSIASGFAASHAYLSAEGIAIALSVSDFLEDLLDSVSQQNPSTEQRKELKEFRESAIIGFSKSYPFFAVERIDRFGKAFLPELRVSPIEIFSCLCMGMDSVDPQKISEGQVFTFYIRFFVLVIRTSHLFSEIEAGNLMCSMMGYGEKIVSNETLPKRMLAALAAITQEIRTLQKVPFSSFKNLYAFISANSLLMKRLIGFVDFEYSKNFSEVVNAFSDMAARVSVENEQQRAEVFRLRDAMMASFCAFRPAFGIEWISQSVPAASWRWEVGLTASINTLDAVGLEEICATYAAEQFSRIFSFAMSRFHEMHDDMRSFVQKVFLGTRRRWISSKEVSSGLVSDWTKELTSLLEKIQPSQKSGSGKAKKALPHPDHSGGEAAKKLRSPQYLDAVLNLLQNDLVSIVDQERAPDESVAALLPSLLSVVDKVIALFDRGPRSDTAYKLIVIIGEISPDVLISQLNAMEAGKAPCGHIRRMERLLSACGRLSSLSDLQTRLFLLEYAGAELERFCYRQGLRLEPHPQNSSLTTVCSGSERSPLHLQMEESICKECLDISCVTNCKEYENDPSQRSWALFTLLFYVRSFIKQERRWYAKMYWEIERAISASERDGDALGSRSLAPELVCNDPVVQSYECFCSGCPSPQRLEPEVVLDEAIQKFSSLFQASYTWSQGLKKTFQSFWPCYERGVEAYRRHTTSIGGYASVFPVSDGPVCPRLLSCGDAQIKAVAASSFQPWIQRLLTGGEVGLAMAVFESMVPGDADFVKEMLRKFDLVDEEKEASSPDFEPSPPAEEEVRKTQEAAARTPKEKTRAVHKQKPRKETTYFRPPQEQRREEEDSSPASQSSSSEKEVLVEAPQVPEEPPKLVAPKPARVLIQVRSSDIESILTRPIGTIASRVHIWRRLFFRESTQGRQGSLPSLADVNTEGLQDQCDRHTYPYEIANLVREFGVRETWGSAAQEQTRDSYVCIGRIDRYRKGLPSLFGIFSEGISRGDPPVVFHHDVLERSQESLIDKYLQIGTFFRTKTEELFQRELYQRVCETGSFFAPMGNAPSVKYCNGRFFVQIAEGTMRIDDRQFGNAYLLALKVRKLILRG